MYKTTIVSQMENKDKQEDDLLISYIKQENPNEIWIKAKTNLAMDLAIEESAKQKEQTLDEMIPQELMAYQSVFDKVAQNFTLSHLSPKESWFIPESPGPFLNILVHS